jgi:hypothetical protein
VQRLGRSCGTSASASRIRTTGLVLLIAYLAVVGWFALQPLAAPWVAPPNLHLFATIRADLAEGSPEAFSRLTHGLARLAPLGVLLPLASGHVERPLACLSVRAAGTAALISSGMALLQSGVPGHSVNIDQVVLNTAGVLLTGLLVFPLVRAWLRRRGTHGGQRWRDSAHGMEAPAALPLRDEARGGASPTAVRAGIAP